MNFKHYIALSLGLMVGLSNAQVVSGTHVIGTSSNFEGAALQLTVLQEAEPRYGYFNPTSIWLAKSDNVFTQQTTITPVTWNVDEMADLYLAQAGDVLTTETIAEGRFSPLLTIDTPYAITVDLDSDFYLGMVTGVGGNGNGPNRDVFGWVHLQNSAEGLTVLDSAMAYGYAGMVVGTVTAVPELSTTGQLALGLLALGAVCGASSRRSQGGSRAHRTHNTSNG